MIDRRRFLAAGAALPLLGVATGVYAVGVEPNLFLQVKRYSLTPAGWPAGSAPAPGVISDIHAGEPFMGAGDRPHLRGRQCAQSRCGPAAWRFQRRPFLCHPRRHLAADRRSPFGPCGRRWVAMRCSAITTGAWRPDDAPSDGTVAIRRALSQAGIKVLENDALPLLQERREILARRPRRPVGRAHARPWRRGWRRSWARRSRPAPWPKLPTMRRS